MFVFYVFLPLQKKKKKKKTAANTRNSCDSSTNTFPRNTSLIGTFSFPFSLFTVAETSHVSRHFENPISYSEVGEKEEERGKREREEKVLHNARLQSQYPETVEKYNVPAESGRAGFSKCSCNTSAICYWHRDSFRNSYSRPNDTFEKKIPRVNTVNSGTLVILNSSSLFLRTRPSNC